MNETNVHKPAVPAPRTELDYLRQMADDIKFIRNFLTISAVIGLVVFVINVCWILLTQI